MRILLILFCAILAGATYLQVELNTSGSWTDIKLSDYGFDLENITSLVFQIKTCGFAQLHLMPMDDAAPFYRFAVNVSENISGRLRKCVVLADGTDDCFESERLDLEPCCDEYQTYWTMVKDSKEIMLGKGNVPGSDVLSVLSNDGPFKLWEIILRSKKDSAWRICVNQGETSQDACTSNTTTNTTAVPKTTQPETTSPSLSSLVNTTPTPSSSSTATTAITDVTTLDKTAMSTATDSSTTPTQSRTSVCRASTFLLPFMMFIAECFKN